MKLKNYFTMTLGEIYKNANICQYNTGIFFKKKQYYKEFFLGDDLYLYFEYEENQTNKDNVYIYLNSHDESIKMNCNEYLIDFIDKKITKKMEIFNKKYEIQYWCKSNLKKVDFIENGFGYMLEFSNLNNKQIYFSYAFNSFNKFIYEMLVNNDLDFVSSKNKLMASILISSDFFSYHSELMVNISSEFNLKFNYNGSKLKNLSIIKSKENEKLFYINLEQYNIRGVISRENEYYCITNLLRFITKDKFNVFNQLNSDKKYIIYNEENDDNELTLISYNENNIEYFKLKNQYSLLIFIVFNYILEYLKLNND